MTIIHLLDNFIYELFPHIEKNQDSLEKAISEFYTINNIKPKIQFKEDFIEIEIDTNHIDIERSKFDKLISLCEDSKFEEAKTLAENLISSNPQVSEYHRILGQVFSEIGDQEEAVNCLIDALRWNPKNEWALLMMGNIFTKLYFDIETALKYYDQVLVVKPDDSITLNNIGANLMQLGKEQEAIHYFEKALISDPNYLNTYYAMALVSHKKSDYANSLNWVFKGIKQTNKQTNKQNNNSNKQFYFKLFQLAIESASKLKSEIDTQKIIREYTAKLSYLTDKEIKVEADESISTAAKIEFAENYDRDYHFVKYKPNHNGIEHLIIHELIHLELVEEARKESINKLFISSQNNKSVFFHSLEKEANKLRKSGVSEENIINYFSALFDGLNRQIYNTPIDLFIEERIYNQWDSMRPIQFLSLLQIFQEGIEATTNLEIVANSPKSILSVSKILNLVSALQFKDLFHFDLTEQFKATKLELDQAAKFYEEYKEYREDKKPAEEYELVNHWAEDLKLDQYFELVSESTFRQKTLESVLEEIENDPMGINSIDPEDDKQMEQFLEDHSSEEINMAVVMFMSDAIKCFSGISIEETKKIAFEIATIGTQGIDPNKKNYVIPSIKNSNFSGYKTLAYYYVSWAIAIPEMLSQLQLPFDKEYELATKYLNL